MLSSHPAWGAWIEITISHLPLISFSTVAPRMGCVD